MKKKQGGKRKNAGRKPIPYLLKKQGISLTVHASGAQVEKYGKEHLKQAAKMEAQLLIDNLK
jgi:hypothetical protein